jgi:hypothetical protein
LGWQWDDVDFEAGTFRGQAVEDTQIRGDLGAAGGTQGAERLLGGAHHHSHRGRVGGQPGCIDVDAVEGEGDRHDKRGVPQEPAIDVGADHRRKAGAIENALQFPDPRGRGAIPLAEHRLLLIDQHVPNDRAIPDTAGRREAEQSTLPEGVSEPGLAVGCVAEEQDV